jgi:hypothetical protein
LEVRFNEIADWNLRAAYLQSIGFNLLSNRHGTYKKMRIAMYIRTIVYLFRDEANGSMLDGFYKYMLANWSAYKVIIAGDCGICFEEILQDEYQRLPCAENHHFHKRCISRWFARQDRDGNPRTCPLCRHQVI